MVTMVTNYDHHGNGCRGKGYHGNMNHDNGNHGNGDHGNCNHGITYIILLQNALYIVSQLLFYVQW